MARNYFIFKEILKTEGNSHDPGRGSLRPRGELSLEKLLVKSSLKLCPLETLILLNSYWKIYNNEDRFASETAASWSNFSEEKEVQVNKLKYSEFIRKFSNCKGTNMLILNPSYGFPVSLRQKYFSGMGFDEGEIKYLLLHDESFDFKSVDSKGKDLHYTQSDYIPTMKQRLSILRENDRKMGLVTASHYFKVMKHWGAFLTRLGEKAKDNDMPSNEVVSDGKNQNFNMDSKTLIDDIVKELTTTSKNKHMNNVLEYLNEYFNHQDNEKHLKKDIFDLPKYERFSAANIRNVRLHQICQALDWLNSRGFNKSQIRDALPLIFYHPALLEQKLFEIQRMEEFQPWYEQLEALNHDKSNKNRILQVLLYLIEKEFNFTDEGTYFAQGVNEEAKSMNGYFSENLCNEILAYSGVRLIPSSPKNENITDEAEQIIGNFDSEHLDSVQLGRIQFQDYIYVHNPNRSHKPTSTMDSVPKNGHSVNDSFKLASSDVKNKNVIRIFSTLSDSNSASNNFQRRNMSSTSNNDDGKKGANYSYTSRLFVLYNPFKWLEMKLKYFALTNNLDPNFDEQEFKRGAKQVNKTWNM